MAAALKLPNTGCQIISNFEEFSAKTYEHAVRNRSVGTEQQTAAVSYLSGSILEDVVHLDFNKSANSDPILQQGTVNMVIIVQLSIHFTAQRIFQVNDRVSIRKIWSISEYFMLFHLLQSSSFGNLVAILNYLLLCSCCW